MDSVTSSLFDHCTDGNVKKLVKLLKKYPISSCKRGGNIDINKANNDRWTALMRACYNGHKEIVEILIQNNADINKADDDGWTALMHACVYDNREIIGILIKNGADIDKFLE